MMNDRRFIPMKRADRNAKFMGQFAVLDDKFKRWTPMFVFPMIAKDFANMLESGEKSIDDFDWDVDDGRWDRSWRPDRNKFEILDRDNDRYYDVQH